MTTHGTRSAYNRGCRCEACREASRLARARQREAVLVRVAAEENDADVPTVASPWGFGVMLGVGAVWCFWHARRIDADESPEGEATRRRWILAGLLFTGLALGLAYLAGGEDSESI